jgi:hypothetical protein
MLESNIRSLKVKRKKSKSQGVLILILFAVAAAAIFLYVSNFTAINFQSKAEAFFNAAAQNNYPEAVSFLSSGLKASLTPAELEKYVNRMATVNYTSSGWNKRTISDNLVELLNSSGSGEHTSSNIEIVFVKENGDWKILSIKVKGPVSSPSEAVKKIPSLDSLKSLVYASLNILSYAITSGNFFDFYRALSLQYQHKTTPSGLKTSFNVYGQQGISLKPTDESGVVFDEVPDISAEGVLLLKGYYPTRQYPVYFELGYRQELFQWRLDNIKVSIQDK